MISVQNLSKRYGSTVAVDDLSFEVGKGEVVGLLGPNGAGKSTTLKILSCFISATAGTASINGFDTFEQPIQVRAQIGYLPEGCPLYQDMDVTAFLGFCAEVRGIAPRDRKLALERVVSECDLGAVRRKRIAHLSKGYRQRVGIAQALIHNPPVLILDEPTSGLDPNQIRDILGLITELGRERTVVHSTHILPEVEATSGRVLIIHHGKIVAQGAPRDLVGRGARVTVHLTVRATGQGADAQRRVMAAGFTAVTAPAAGGLLHLAIQAPGGRDVSTDLYRLAVENGWDVTELRTETTRLEDVFASLTRDVDAQAVSVETAV
jgi:ABC-2 type transport system ATP-binding protein